MTEIVEIVEQNIVVVSDPASQVTAVEIVYQILEVGSPGPQGAAGVSGSITDGDYGDITVSGSGTVLTIDPNVVTNTKLADVPTATFKGRTSPSSGDPEDLTVSQAKTLLSLSGTNSGDQTSIVGITGTLAEFNAALTAVDFATGGGTATGTNTGDQTSIVGITGTLAEFNAALTAVDFATGGGTATGTNTGDQTITLTGNVTGSGTGSFIATIANAAVTLAKMADVATATVFYRKTAATGVPEVQTLATLKTDLGLTGTNSGDQTSIVGITGSVAQFNTAITDGDLATGGGTATGTNTGDQTITLTGNVTGSGTGSFIATIANAAVTLPKMADVPSASVFYRKTAATGAPEVQTLATLKTDLGLTGTNTGDQTSIVGIIGTVAQFNTAVTDGDFATGNGTANGTNTGDQTITLTGNVTGSGTGSFIATIANAAVTLAKMADVATATVFYRKTAATGVPEVQTLATLKTDLGLTGTNSGDQSIVLSGDVSGSGTTAITTTLATVNSNVGSFGLAASVSQFTVNAKGLITAAANVVISIASTAISDSTAAGRAMLTAATAAAQTALLSVFVPSGASAAKGLVPSPPGVVGVTNFLREDGTWALPPGASGGEANTASNVGVGGVGVFKQKTVFNLEFKNINVASTKLSVTNDAANNEIDLDVIEANLTLGNLGGNLPIAGGGTAATTAAAARSNLGFGTTGAGNVFGAAINLGLSSSVAANALTVALKGADGNDPSATNPVLIPFRNTTATIGTPTWLSVTAAASIVVSSGSTLGTANSNSFTFWVVGFNDAGTFRMGIIQAGNNRLLSGSDLVSSTAEGGAGAADALDTFYTGTAVTAKAYCILGYVEYIPGLATAGTYATAPTETQVFGPGVPVAARLQTLQKFTASGTWTRPAGCRRIFARVVGGGGGAASALGTATTAEVSGGGAAGAYSEGWFDVTATPSIVITVGTGGAGGAAAASNAGVAGIASSLGALMTATGGSLSGVMTDGTTVVANPGAIETAAGTGGDLNVPGSGGDYGMRTSGTTGVGGNGGAGPFGGGPRGAPINTAGSNATAPGSGGSGAASGTATGRAGGNGAAGIIIIEEYY